MPPKIIKHIWFDFSETIACINKKRHDKLCYETYAEIIKKPVNKKLISEYKQLYEKFNHSNSAIFYSLGQASNFWSERVNTVDPSEVYKIADKNIPDVLKKIIEIVPISLFSNLRLDRVLPSLHIDSKLFANILGSDMLKKPKPALDGFYKMIELSGIPSQEILYIGDNIGKDILPAKKVGIKAGLIWKKSDQADYSFEKFEDILNIFR